jgi:hypothetical protein
MRPSSSATIAGQHRPLPISLLAALDLNEFLDQLPAAAVQKLIHCLALGF